MNIVQRIPEQNIQGKRLGRNIEHDERSRAYQTSTVSKIISVKHRQHGLPLTQVRGSCTAEALIGALDSDPNYNGHVYTQADADHLYDEEIRLEGGDPTIDDPGGSGVMVCKAARKLGLISSYTHCFSLDQMLRALVLRPVIVGMNWYSSFDDPIRAECKIDPDAYVRGGHEVLADEVVVEKQRVWFWNSWGREFGQAGHFFMSFATVERLLSEQGDVTVPIP